PAREGDARDDADDAAEGGEGVAAEEGDSRVARGRVRRAARPLRLAGTRDGAAVAVRVEAGEVEGRRAGEDVALDPGGRRRLRRLRDVEEGRRRARDLDPVRPGTAPEVRGRVR